LAGTPLEVQEHPRVIKMRVKLFLIVWLSFIYSAVVYADYDASDLKKLFTDKGQRAQIDAARSGKSSGSELQQTTRINVSGYVTRSDGKSVVWVNNKNTLDSSRIGDVNVQQSSIGKNKKVTVTVDGKTARLKPGETWSKETGKIVDDK
jgi:hypothetical protein